MPRSLPRDLASALRASKPSKSAIFIASSMIGVVVADVVLQRHRRLVREGGRRNEVPPAELGRDPSSARRAALLTMRSTT